MIYTWEEIPEGTKKEGENWYRVALEKCLDISNKTNVPLHKVVGVVAVLSPKMNWENNLKQAEIICQTGDCSALSRSKMAACEILNCDGKLVTIMLEINGRKTFSFFTNILNIRPSNVTLDTHMGQICGVPNWTPRQYYKWEVNLIRMAQDLGIEARALQATLWLHHKNQKSKKVNG